VIRILRLFSARATDSFVQGDFVKVRGIEGTGLIYSLDQKAEHAVVSYGSHRQIVPFWRLRLVLKPSRHDRKRDA
jgi:hypothetical protein